MAVGHLELFDNSGMGCFPRILSICVPAATKRYCRYLGKWAEANIFRIKKMNHFSKLGERAVDKWL